MAKSKTDIAADLLQDMASTGISVGGGVLEVASQSLPGVANTGVGMLMDSKDLAVAVKDLAKDSATLIKQAKSEIDYKAAKKDPEIQQLLALRSYANGMLKLQNVAQDQAQQQLGNLAKLETLGAQLDADPAMKLPDGLSADDARMLSMKPDERAQAIGNRRQDLGEKIEQMKEAAGQLDIVINGVNSHPRISSPEFRKLEAKHDLENNLGKAGVKTVRDMMNATKSGVSMAGNALGVTSTVLTVAGAGGAVTAAALGAASAGVAIAGGAMMVAGGTAGMAAAAYKHHELSKLQTAANTAAKDSMQMSLNAETPEDAEQALEVALAMDCVEENARQGKNIEKMKGVRNAGIAVAGVGVATMGTGTLLSAVGAAGYGVGAAPGLILSGVGAGVTAAGGVVAASAQLGISGYKVYQEHLQKQDVNQAKVALEGQEIMNKIAATNNPAERKKLEASLTPKHIEALDGMKQGLKTTLKGLGVEDSVIASQLNDSAQVVKFAKGVMIQRDPKLAAETLAKAALSECHDAFTKRAEGGRVAQGAAIGTGGRAVNIVEADLPQNTPALNALRKLGMDDKKITQTMNAMASHETRQIANKTLQKHTGLK